MDVLWRAFDPAYMQRALVEVLLLAIAGAAVGVFVVVRRMAFFTEALQHTVFPGIVVAFLFGQSLLLGALAAVALTVVLFTLASRRPRIDSDAFLGLLLSSFFAAGVVLVSRSGGYQHDLTTLLFGRILTVDRAQLIQTGVITVIVVVVIAVVYKELVMATVDPSGAEAMGYRLAWLDLVLNALVALVVVAAVQAVGTVLLLAFIVTPAAAARAAGLSFAPMFLGAAVLSMFAGWLGLVSSYELSVHQDVNVASGAAIVVCATALFVIVSLVGAARRRLVARHT